MIRSWTWDARGQYWHGEESGSVKVPGFYVEIDGLRCENVKIHGVYEGIRGQNYENVKIHGLYEGICG